MKERLMTFNSKINLGFARCQCQTCGRVFSSVSSFDKHRITQDGKQICANPETVGLELKPNGVYGGIGSFDRPKEGDAL